MHLFPHTKEPLTERELRDTLKDEAGRELVILRIRYPAFATSPRKKQTQQFNRFYEQAAHGFESFARGQLLEQARKNPAGTPPCGAVLRWNATEDTPGVLTVSLSGNVFDGTDSHAISPDVRQWDRKTGLQVTG